MSRLERRRKKKEGAEKEEEKPHRFEQVPPLFSQPFFLVPPSLAQKKKSDRFCTRTKAEACEAGFGRVWALSAGCRLSGVKRRKFSTLGTRQHHYLWALLSNSYEEKELFRFTLHGVLNDSKAALAFEKEEDARAWHAALERALEGLHAAFCSPNTPSRQLRAFKNLQKPTQKASKNTGRFGVKICMKDV